MSLQEVKKKALMQFIEGNYTLLELEKKFYQQLLTGEIGGNAELEEAVENLSSSLDGLLTRLEALEESVSTTQSDLATTQSGLEALETVVETNKTDSETRDQDLSDRIDQLDLQLNPPPPIEEED